MKENRFSLQVDHMKNNPHVKKKMSRVSSSNIKNKIINQDKTARPLLQHGKSERLCESVNVGAYLIEITNINSSVSPKCHTGRA